MKNIISNILSNRIDSICKQYRIENYSINSDGSIDVNGSVNLFDKKLTKFPVKFNIVSGNFNCSLNKLTSLQGSPHTVGGNCYFNSNKLTSLEGSPVTIGGDLMCGHNQLTSLSGSTIVVRGNFVCNNNKLTSLVGAPTTVGGDFYCHFNQITSLVGSPLTVGRFYNASGNVISSTYSVDVDIEIGDGCFLSKNKLPPLFIDKLNNIKLILKYQRHFEIWNEDLSFNEENFNVLISEIEDGLR